jgi:hypothetical protein
MTVPRGGEVMSVRRSGRRVDELRMKVDEEKKNGQRETNLNRMCGQGKLGSRGCATREGTSEEKPMKFASSNIRLQSKGTAIEKTRCIKRTTI